MLSEFYKMIMATCKRYLEPTPADYKIDDKGTQIWCAYLKSAQSTTYRGNSLAHIVAAQQAVTV